MNELAHQKIAALEWNEFEDRLHAVTRGTGRGTADEMAMREYFGDREFEELRQLAVQSRAARARAPALGNVVLLPGIMGSNLLTVNATGAEEVVWVNLFRLALGRAARLKLTAEGTREENSTFKVKATILEKRTYTRAMLKLGARWNVRPFPFDWRKDIDAASESLATFVQEQFPGQPVNLVAHSMGGLVCRNFIRLHKDLWEKMRVDGNQGGRLVMLGTPNYGSFAIPQALTGVETLVRWLARIDLSHDLPETLEILNSFVGSYQMLPAPQKLPATQRALYRRDTWGSFPISDVHLKRAEAFHQALEAGGTIDRERMTYIAGCNRQTIAGLEIVGPGEFRYTTTFAGDGRVPFELGLLPDVPTYYREEDHGSLPKNDRVLAAIDELLERGRTSVLADRPTVTRAVLPDEARWHRSIGEHYTGADLERIARRAVKDEAAPDEVRAAEETLMQAVLGEVRPARQLEQVLSKPEAPPAKRVRLRIEVVKGDVRQVAAPVVVVGQYKGVAPISAIGALDEALNHWISQAGAHGLIGAELGQVFFIPVNRGQIGAKAVLLAGMGEEGKFSRYDLRYLMLNVTYAISALEIGKFATVLIGAGAGNVGEEDAIRGLLFGVCDALARLEKTQGAHIVVVERDADRFQRIYQVLRRIQNEDSAARLKITVQKRELPARPSASSAPGAALPVDLPKELFGPRVTIEREGDLFGFAALTETAVIPVREVEIQSFFSQGITDRLVASTTREEQETFGRLLNTSLIPEDFQQLFETNRPLTLILDSSTAAFPWEMTCFARPEGPAFFGTHLGLTRQFRTLLSAAPGIVPPIKNSLKILVVADPAPEPEYQLSGARWEGREVVKLLNEIKQTWNLDIEVVDRIGPDECNPVEILGLILDGGFDIVHFAGHGVFDEEQPARGGWVFGKERILSAREIFRARRVPRLVFANACFSAVVNPGKPLTAENLNRHFAGIAEAFFERGVQNYIGASWPVQDDLAVRFASVFYEYALTGAIREPASPGRVPDELAGPAKRPAPSPKPLAQALAEARKQILHKGSTWGAYQHYGQANALLIRATVKPAPAPGAKSKEKGKASKQ